MVTKLTQLGAAVMARALDGETITFTHVQLGNGEYQIAYDATALSNPLLTLGIDEITVASKKATLSVSFSNSQLDTGFRWTEAGIFCEDPDDPSAELLYAYGFTNPLNADYIAASSEEIQELQIDFLVYVSDAENVTALINESTVYATKAAFDAHTADHNNPHAVTKEQVGLGNLPNLAPNDMTVTYTEPQELTQPESGGTVSAFFGRVSGAVRALFSHLADTTKHISASERTAWNGKSAPEHKHSAADLISGTLGVARGGTGCTTAKQAGKELVPGFFDSPALITGNLNDCTATGFYYVAYAATHKPPNAPSSTAYMLVFQHSSNSVGQLFISMGTGTSGEQKVWSRLKIDSLWDSWT